MNQPTLTPTRKVSVGGIGGAAGIIVTWILTSAGLDVPAEVGAAISTLLGFVAAYMVPENDQTP